MVTYQTDSRGKRSTGKFFRYALRRRPCMGMIVISSIIIPILIFLCIFFFFWIRSSYLHNEIFRRDKARLKARGDHISFHHCSYNDTGTFNTSFCPMYCGSAAESWRIQRLQNDRYVEPSCLDKYEHTSCHNGDFCLPTPESLPVCRGTNWAQEDNEDESLDSPNSIVQAVNDEVIKNAKGRLILANQLIAKCPQCTVRSDYFKFKEGGLCFRKLATIAEGWPALWQYCTNLQQAKHGVNCELVPNAETLL